MVVEVVTDLARDHYLVAHVPESICEERLSFTRAVRVRGIEVVDAPFTGLIKQPYGPLLVHLSPPAGRDRPHSEADLGDHYIGAAQRTVFHFPLPVRVRTLDQPPLIYYILASDVVDFLSICGSIISRCWRRLWISRRDRPLCGRGERGAEGGPRRLCGDRGRRLQ